MCVHHARIGETIGRELRHVDVPGSAAQSAMAGMGMPDSLVALLKSLQHVIKQRWAADIGTDVRTLTGHAPRRFDDFMAASAAVWR